ncbi:MAG: hypothetical protein MO853_08805 [Candidatus Protistobacter heckmanni]|nr:hypothetical protein [Candidatus Protistobacter heckmanni]
MKMIYALWSRQAVAELILNRYGIIMLSRSFSAASSAPIDPAERSFHAAYLTRGSWK